MVKEETYISNELSSSSENVQYDTHVKRLLKDKGVLAYILVYAVEEFKGYSLEEAKSAIEGEPIVSRKRVRPEAIRGETGESSLPGEGKMFYDIVFSVITKDNERQKLFINIEAQKSFYPGYDLVTRGIVYGARQLSDQMDTEFTANNYDDAKKVYSIWICMNSPIHNKNNQDVADTITEYSFAPKVLYSAHKDEDCVAYGRYDLISVLFVCLQDGTINSKNKLIGMLSTLLSSTLDTAEKKITLETEYNLPMTREMEKEAAAMCNLSEAIAENAAEKATEEANIKAVVNLLEFKIPEEQIRLKYPNEFEAGKELFKTIKTPN